MINCGLAGSGATGSRLTIRTRGASPVDPSPRCAFQIRASQICTTEIDIVQPRILEIGTDQVPARQVRTVVFVAIQVCIRSDEVAIHQSPVFRE